MSTYASPWTERGSDGYATPRRPQRQKKSSPSSPPLNGVASPHVQKMRQKFELPEARTPAKQLPCKGIARTSESARRDDSCPSNLYSEVRKKLTPAGSHNRPSDHLKDPVVPDKVWKRNANCVSSSSPSSVRERAKIYETGFRLPANECSDRRTMSEEKPPKPPAPLKPPRTFAHDIYSRNKLANGSNGRTARYAQLSSPKGVVPKCEARSWVSNEVGHEYDEVEGPYAKPFVDLTQTTVRPARSTTNLRRSFSDEHIYAEPDMLRKENGNVSSKKAEKKNLHYMSTPIAGLAEYGQPSAAFKGDTKRARAFTSQIRDVIHQSFSSVKKHMQGTASKPDDPCDPHGDSSSEVSVKDVQQRLIYVRSIKKRAYACCSNSDGAAKPKILQNALLVGYDRVNSRLPLQPEVFYRFPTKLDNLGFDPVVIAHLCLPVQHGSVPSESMKSTIYYFGLSKENRGIMFFHCLYIPNAHEILRRRNKGPVVLCIATSGCAPAFYCKLLHHLENPVRRLSEEGWTILLNNLAQQSLPSPGCKAVYQKHSVGQGDVTVVTERPLDDRFEWAKLTPLLGVLDIDILLRIVSTLLSEKRVMLVCADCQQLYQWVEAVESLLYPFKWTFTKIPVVPKSLIIQCSSMEPYLLGVPSSLIHTALDIISGPVLVVDLDHGSLLSDGEDVHTVLPNKLQRALCTALSLAKNMTDPTERVRDMMITEAFVRMFVEILGHCDSHISLLSNGTYAFQKEAFMRMPSSRGVQMFLQWFVETQMFELFLSERAQRVRQLQRTPHHHLLPKGVFERRANEYQLDCEQSGMSLKEVSKRMRNFGEKLRNLKMFQ
ncbi:DENN domain-containing protein 2C-like isoform X2 [Ornithodoros turicata]|uniref:DENN domain-containing protein 2C-like isoform X2 n=1 Tax=Ornithodoros turicata TaxID=34597 RepID=UPI003138B8CD